jgi:hypothetical protein
MRLALDCWPGDRLELRKDGSRVPNDELSFFLNSSEHTGLVFAQPGRPSAGRLFVQGVDDIAFKFADGSAGGPGATKAPSPFAVIDIASRTADAERGAFPLFTHSNPMAASLRASGAGRTSVGTGKGASGIPASFDVHVRTVGNWEDVIQQPTNDTQRTYGGYSVLPGQGSERVILTEVPLVQPTSLAQYTHANFGVRDQQGLFSAGNSFANPLVEAQSAFQRQKTDSGVDLNWTEFDQSYLLNAALWDGFFLSSLAPWMKVDNTTATLPDHPRYRTEGREDDDDRDDSEDSRLRSLGIAKPDSIVAPNPNISKPLSQVRRSDQSCLELLSSNRFRTP